MRVQDDVESGIVYANPIPHLRSQHAYFPSVVSLDGGELLCTFAVGEAFEAVNLRLHAARSADQGTTWSFEGPVTGDLEAGTFSECGRITALGQHRVVGLLHRHDRRNRQDEGLSNTANLGFVPTHFDLTHSEDGGHTWSSPKRMEPPMTGSAFELCSPITVLSDGRWLLPTSTWRGWEGDLPHGHRMVAWISNDAGRSWSDWQTVMHARDGTVDFWESKIVEMANGTLIAVAWGYDHDTCCDTPNQFAVSRDGGNHWSPNQSTQLTGQTLTPLAVDAEHLFCAYRRIDRPGLWGQIARISEAGWENVSEIPLWGTTSGGLTGTSDDMVEIFQNLRFGAPSIARLADGRILVVFWCYEDGSSVIRWFRLSVS